MEQGEADIAFAKIAVLRRQVTQEQVQECFRTLGQNAMSGQESTIASIMVAKSLLPAAEADAIAKMVEAGQVVPELPDYTLLHELGRGGMGAVYKGLQTKLDRKVAIKILFPELARNERYLTRFLNEARAVAKLQHPNIVSAIDIGEAGGFHYFAMEFVEGETVAAIIKTKGPYSEAGALDITMQIARALEHAWKHRLVHRDVKPENILMTEDGQAKLADLGIAKQVDSDMSLTMEGGVVGSPNFISPEQANGIKDIDTRSDIYSLGATLYFMLIGEAPYKGDTAAVVMAQHMVAKLPNPRDRRPELTEGVCRLIEKMMAKDRTNRPLDPAALMKDIEAVKTGATPSGPQLGTGESAVEKTRAAASKMSGAPAGPQRGGSGGGLQAVGARGGIKGPGSRGSSSEMKRVGTAEVRAVTNKEAGRLGARKQGLDPMLVVGIVVVLVAAAGLYFVLFPGKTPGHGPTNTIAATNNTPPVVPANMVQPGNTTPTEEGKDKEAREGFEYVAGYEKDNPEQYADLIDKYSQVEKRYAGSTWSFKAGDAAKRIREVWKGKLDAQLAELDSALKPMLFEGRYAEAKKELESRFPLDRVPEVIRDEVGRRWNDLMDSAQRSFQDAMDAAARAEKAGKWNEAFAAYRGLIETSGLPEYVSQAKDRLEMAERAAEVAKARAAAEAERTLQSRFNDRVRSVRDLVLKWDFSKAIQAVDAEKSFKDTPLAAELATIRKDLDRLQQFKTWLMANVPKKVKVESKSFLQDDRVGGTLSGATDGDFEVAVKGGGKRKYPWTHLKPDESLALARLAADRSDPATPVMLATFALEFGMIEKAQAELKGNHPDVPAMQQRLAAAQERLGRVDIDAAIKQVESSVEGSDFAAAATALQTLETKWSAKLDANQKVIVQGLGRSVREGHARVLLAKAKELSAARKMQEAIEVVGEILTKYADTEAAKEAIAVQADFEEGAVLRICTFEPATQRPWRWSPAGAGFSLNDDMKFVKEGKYSGVVTYPVHGAGGGTMPCIRFATLPKNDWTGYNALSMWVYVPEQKGDQLGIRIFVRGEECKFSYEYTVDWQGWKEVRVPFTQFTATGGATWDKVQEIALPILVGKGGNYYIDDVRIVKDGA